MENSIKQISKNKGIKLNVLAKQTGLSQTTVYSIARGSSVPTLITAYKISKALNTTIEDLFFKD
ncbi:helix-turn-helix transcriptional regulator [Clostridium felsineum]|uniref:Uncharacterized protein n=1 Tax=Clostridium felsineum TaxID=36839 RepID=A0A1S8L3M5_9CLOT|nr:helix-turn-helix domain-containing protein [Clostridium felsineum]URZ08939.1 hypothetical protein CLROS_043430 [Clostridium felsineum]URZ09567.1 hypothetical protein CROST_002480 [Clostridium felsineum]